MMKKIYLLLGLLLALFLSACSTPAKESKESVEDSTNTESSSTLPEESDSGDPSHVHTWDEAVYSWNGLECTAETVCTDSDCQEPLTETVTANYVKDTDATCYLNEKGHFEALFENDAFEDQITEANSVEQEDSMLPHTLTEVEYVWDADTCTASVACTVEECGFELEETATISIATDTEGDCENNAKGHYEAVFESEYFTTQTTEANSVEIPDSQKHQKETSLNEERRQIITACTLCGDEFEVKNLYDTYTDGESLNGGKNYVLPTPISKTELSGKAIRLEFKFESETGSFAFSLLQYDPWIPFTNIVTITKTASGFTVIDNGTNLSCGRIVDAGNGWYAWEINAAGFTVSAGAEVFDLVVPRNTVVGTVCIDWSSLSVVEAYTSRDVPTVYKTGDSLGQTNLSSAILMSQMEGKAIRFEFKFISETGSFGFQVMGLEWNRISDIVTVTKTVSGISANFGRIVEAGDGWYAWELNKSGFTGDGAAAAPTIDFIYPRNNVEGDLYIDWQSVSVVDEYEVDTRLESSTKYENGSTLNGGANYVLPTPISMAELSGKAIRFEFKFESETGSFAFSLMEYAPWLRLTNTVTIKKTESGFTVTDDGSNKACGRIVDAGDGWYAWEINAADFPGSGAATAQMIDIIVPRNTVEGTLYLDWNSFCVVDAYEVDTRLETATKYEAGQKLELSLPGISMSALQGKSVHLEFKFTTESGAFSFSLIQAEPWLNITGRTDITKNGDTITATNGRVVEVGNGWYAWEINASDLQGDGAKTAENLNYVFPRDPVQGTVYIDWNSLSIVRAFEIYANGEKINGGANYVLPTPVPTSALSGKAIRFEFKFESETGSFAFSLLQYEPWTPFTNIVTITKTESGFTVTDSDGNKPCGRIVDVGDGWYAWEINVSDFPVSAGAEIFDLVVPRNTVEGTLYLDWNSFCVVDAYANN